MIPPGGEGKIETTLRPKGTHTEISKNIVVVTNDPEQPRFTLTMKGTLLIDMSARPPSVAISGLAPGKPGTGSFSLLRADGSAATIESAHIEDTDGFSVHEIETEPGALVTYQVRFEGREEVGTTATNVIVKTTGKNTPQLAVPVRATATFNLRYPKRFGFAGREGQPLERTLRITTRRGDAPKISKVVDLDDLLEVEVLDSRGPTTAIRVRVREDPPATADASDPHVLQVHTDDPDEPVLELEYRVPAPRAQRPTKAMSLESTL